MEVPIDAKLLKLGYQSDQLYAWYLVDPEITDTKYIYYEIYGTGQAITSNQANFYVDTLFDPQGFVWHIFEYCHNE